MTNPQPDSEAEIAEAMGHIGGDGRDWYPEKTEKILKILERRLARLTDIEKRYNALLLAVGNKYPDETRHQTALRYIRNAERGSELQQSSKEGESNE